MFSLNEGNRFVAVCLQGVDLRKGSIVYAA